MHGGIIFLILRQEYAVRALFSIQAKNEEDDEVTAKAKAAFKQLRAKAERGETPELTLDEINEEIREVRRLRKERNGICSH